jgi:hypothetical protein
VGTKAGPRGEGAIMLVSKAGPEATVGPMGKGEGGGGIYII